MKLPSNKTKIVCTIGPASLDPAIMEQMIRAGMNIARLNFSHGDFSGKGEMITRLRAAAAKVGRPLTIMADLPGPKMRVGQIANEPIDLKVGESFTLTADDIVGDVHRVSMSFPRLPQVVKPGNTLFLNDGLIQLEVIKVVGNDVQCRVLVGGELRSRKGLNLPGIDLGIGAFTDHDRDCLKFALENGVDAVSQSFVQSAADLQAVRAAAAELGYKPFVIAKIERSDALDRLDEIFAATDGIMIARGDLGVEVPIEKIALVQKMLMQKANQLGKPVITATQMLESMTASRLPTRAEATDVANAILDGTDCVMLSGESAMGKYPVDAVAMLSKIAAAIEPHRQSFPVREVIKAQRLEGKIELRDLIALAVEDTFEHATPAAVLVPTLHGVTVRSVARFRLPAWILAVSPNAATCQQLQFSYGVWTEHEPTRPADWNDYANRWVKSHEVAGDWMVLTEGPASDRPNSNHRVEIIELKNS